MTLTPAEARRLIACKDAALALLPRDARLESVRQALAGRID